MSHNFANLQTHILARSAATEWLKAVAEWTIDVPDFIEDDEPLATCPCSHYPIRELCWLSNHVTAQRTFVGNVCIKVFMQMSHVIGIVDGFQRVRADRSAGALNEAAIAFAHRNRWINEWEHSFYLDTWRKRKLTPLQAAHRQEINQKVLRALTLHVGRRRVAHAAQTTQIVANDGLA